MTTIGVGVARARSLRTNRWWWYSYICIWFCMVSFWLSRGFGYVIVFSWFAPIFALFVLK